VTMRVLVTGASGMLGGTVARSLAARGDDVVVMQRRPSGLGLTERLGDVSDPDACAAAVDGVDAVVHLAAKVHVVGAWEDYVAANVTGTATLLAAARAAGATRFIQVSSPSVAFAGDSLVAAPAGPADPDRARGPYSRSKAMAEELALAEHDVAFSVLAVRPHLVWGPGDTQLVARIVERGRSGRLAIVGRGTALIDTTYVDNAADALVAALDHADTAGGRAYVVSNGEPRPVAEILGSICAAAGVPRPSRGLQGPRSTACGRDADATTTRRSPGSSPSSWPPRTGSTSGRPETRLAGPRRSVSTRGSPAWPRRTRGESRARQAQS
jgi:nucleoside-diphosphate-sugar epimerase